jgi:pilus assembly protein CpaF
MPEGTLVTAVATGIVVFAAAVVVLRRIGLAEARSAARLKHARGETKPAPFPTVPELCDIVHKKAVAGIDTVRLKLLDPEAVKRDIRRVVEHCVDTENPLLNRLEREAVIKAVAERMTGPRPE